MKLSLFNSCVSALGISVLLSACGGGNSAGQSTVAPPPATGATNSAPTISGTPGNGVEKQTYSFVPNLNDADGDALTVSAENLPDWLTLNASTGELSGTPAVSDIGTASGISLTVSDGKATAAMIFDLVVDPDALEQAIRKGDHSQITDGNIYVDEIVESIELGRTKFDLAKYKLFGLSETGEVQPESLTAVSWDPTHDAARLTSTFGRNAPILISNDVTNSSYTIYEKPLGIIGSTQTSNYMVLGSNPFRNGYRNSDSVNDQMRDLLKNGMSWLTGRDDLASVNFKVVIAHMDDSYYFPDERAIRAWFDTHYETTVSYNDADTCDGAALSGCLDDSVDLLIVSQIKEDDQDAEAITASVSAAMQAGIPVLYTHHDGNLKPLGEELLPIFNVGYEGDNYWRRLRLTDFNPVEKTVGILPDDVERAKGLIEKLGNNGFGFDLSGCDDKSCPDTTSYGIEFLQPVQTLKSEFDQLDANLTNLFEAEDADTDRVQKLMVLLADHYRQNVSFPMDKVTTPKIDFLRSLYADHVVHTARSGTPVQADMGNFSRSDFTSVERENASINLSSKGSFRASGVYAVPGETVKVTRTDGSAVSTRMRINSLRSGATHEFETDGYKRPKHLTSTWMPITSGETIEFTSPYGGPVHISFDEKDLPVSFRFENIGRHAFWDGAEDNAEFDAALAASEFDWAEIVTPGFEVHSKLDKMKETVANPMWGDVPTIASAVEKHIQDYPHILAGLIGPGISEVAEVHNFATSNGLELHTLDQVKHMNADQATCGYGCSGNPYDAYWDFNPLGHGDLHELGHGLERQKHRFEGWPTHASTNWYSYYSKFNYFKNTGDRTGVLSGCQSLPYERLFGQLQDAHANADPAQYMRDLNLTSWQDGASIMIQMMAAAQNEGIFTDGWLMLSHLHLIEREFNDAVRNDADWTVKSTGLGFGGYDRSAAQALGQNDWLLVALSHVFKRDMTDYLSMWGFVFATDVQSYVAGKSFPALPRKYYALGEKDHCLGLDQAALNVDGATAWPVSKSSKVTAHKMQTSIGYETEENCTHGHAKTTSNR